MYKNRLVTKDTYYVGASDRRIALFENIYPLSNGVSYNSYVILDNKTCLLDTVDNDVFDTFLEKVKDVLNKRKLDYLVIHHMEPDHSASIKKIVDEFKEVTLVVNSKIKNMLDNYFDLSEVKMLIVNEGDVLDLGNHRLTFVFAPMVHWPEVMMSYDTYSKTLFSADAFGTFGALNGNLFAHEVNFAHEYLDEARRYYTNIVGKYGPQVQAALKKASTVELETIAPLHGPIRRKDLSYLVNRYDKWSKYEPEVNGVLIVYGSIYGHTAKVANLLADNLALLGIKDIKMYDASKTDVSVLLSESFKYSHIVVASSTYNMGIFTPVENYLLDLKAHAFQNRKFAVIENGSWAPNSGNLIKKILGEMKNITILEPSLTVKSNIKENQLEILDNIANEIAKDFPKVTLNDNPLFKINYGLFLLTSSLNGKYNGCIVNSVNQVAQNPDLIMVSVSKNNYTAKIINETKQFNLSILTIHTPFSLFKRFGYASGKDTNKFEGFTDYRLAKNNIPYLTRFVSGFFALKVVQVVDLNSHFGFICEVNESKELSKDLPVTYSYYLENIKPAVPRNQEVKKGWICKICGYVYEGENLPPDFICPICKHGAKDFERIK